MLCCLFYCACKIGTSNFREEGKKQIARAEKDFEKMAAEKGIAEAFSYYADSSAVIRRRNDSLIKGREAIRNFYSDGYFKTATLKWSPDFIDVAEKGDMGYTFGKFTRLSKDSSGRVSEITGTFHTVWKKQKDGSWKYVWD